MDKKEINEYLAEHLFGPKRGVDFGKECKPASYQLSCCECSRPCNTPDYTADWHNVIERCSLQTDGFKMTFRNFGDKGAEVYLSADNINGVIMTDGHTLGEAVCRAVVEYLKSKED